MKPAAILLAALVLVAAIYDWRLRRIPNWLTLSGIAAGFALNAWFGNVREAAIGFALAVAVYLPLFALRAMGGGDLKLMAAVGAVAGGPAAWLAIFVYTAILGGLAALVTLAVRGGMGRAFANVLHILKRLARLRAPYRDRGELDVSHPQARTLPHGVVIAAGALLYLAVSR
ncbi:MAG: prepilin peptidase [Acidobacteria bacterium]|nr:prepilin peptidase [Acidobacteriota bacterium]